MLVDQVAEQMHVFAIRLLLTSLPIGDGRTMDADPGSQFPTGQPCRRFGSGNVADISSYIKLGPFGRAFASTERQVLLIDEVDKADLEFPNDLLLELDEMRFKIIETNEEIVARERPVVLITSNNEKELPDAFLRRCIFYFIEFPDVKLIHRACPATGRDRSLLPGSRPRIASPPGACHKVAPHPPRLLLRAMP